MILSLNLPLFVPLLAAHLLADFTFQSEAMARRKGHATVLLAHLAIVWLTAYVLLGDWTEWRIPSLVTASHGLIDLVKVRLGQWGHSLLAFLADQGMHLLVLWGIGLLNWTALSGFEPWWLGGDSWSYLRLMVWVGAVVAVTKVAGVIVAKALPSMLERDRASLESDTGFARAGRFIGYLERVLLLIFVMTDQLGAAGFLIAAKSVFRFQKKEEDRRQTEYILVGTLLSFALGIGLAYLFRLMVKG